MQEYSRIIIEEYCSNHDSKKSRQLKRLVEMSYDRYCEGTEEDAAILVNLISIEKDTELKEAIIDLEDYIFPV